MKEKEAQIDRRSIVRIGLNVSRDSAWRQIAFFSSVRVATTSFSNRSWTKGRRRFPRRQRWSLEDIGRINFKFGHILGQIIGDWKRLLLQFNSSHSFLVSSDSIEQELIQSQTSLGSRIVNFFANNWSSPSKIQSIESEMSGVTTPTTLPESLEEAATGASSAPSRQQSSPPTSPATKSESEDVTMEGAEKENEREKPIVTEGEGDEDEDTEGLDIKARALNKLLQTSSVSLINTLYRGFFV